MKQILILMLTLPLWGSAQIITTVAGSTCGSGGDGGPATSAGLNIPYSVAVDSKGNLFIDDDANNAVRKVDTFGIITTIAGNGTAGYSGDGGPATAASIKVPSGIAVDTAGNVYIGDTYNNRVRKVNMSTGIITTVAGNGTAGFSGDGGPATDAGLNGPGGLTIDRHGNLFISDILNNRIRKVTPAGIISTIAGDGTLGYYGDGGPALYASFYRQTDVKVDCWGNVYIADGNNHRIREIDTSGIVRTIAGDGTPGLTGDGSRSVYSELFYPFSIALDVRGNLFIADRDNNRIRKIDTGGIITTYAGTGAGLASGDGGPATAARLNNPWGVGLNRAGDVYISSAACLVRYIYDSMNYLPFFSCRWARSLSVCRGQPTDIDSILDVTDFSATNTDTWTYALSPIHGSVSGTYVTTANKGHLLPAGFSYTADTGYSGMDSFRVAVSNGRFADTVIVYVTISSCEPEINAIGHVNPGTAGIFPNPVTAEVNIAARSDIRDLEIVNLLGQIVFEREYHSPNVCADVAPLKAGLYFIKINGIVAGKFVKQ